MLVQGYGTVFLHPFGLSFYNGLTGGLSGAERLGLELTYWNDAVDQVLLDRLAREGQPGATAALVPTLYPQQGVLTTNRALARAGIILQDEQEAAARGVDRPLPSNGLLAAGNPEAAPEQGGASASPSGRGKAFGCPPFGTFHRQDSPRPADPTHGPTSSNDASTQARTILATA